MREDICSIPVSEVFAPKDGCPICRMVSTLEEHLVEYITGAAMMEPDVRQETNRTGFCPEHFRMMLARRNRLSVALTMESHLKELQQNLDFGGKAPSKISWQLCSWRRMAALSATRWNGDCSAC